MKSTISELRVTFVAKLGQLENKPTNGNEKGVVAIEAHGLHVEFVVNQDGSGLGVFEFAIDVPKSNFAVGHFSSARRRRNRLRVKGY